MKPPTLCVVDMQPCFDAAKEPTTIQRVVGLIKKAKRKNAGIIVLEYAYEPKTLSQIRKAIGKYRKAVYTRKSDDDGSSEVIATLLDRRSFNHKHIQVCGVNTDYCVCETVGGLLSKCQKTKIEVMAQACLSEEDVYYDDEEEDKEKSEDKEVERSRRRTVRAVFRSSKRLRINWSK